MRKLSLLTFCLLLSACASVPAPPNPQVTPTSWLQSRDRLLQLTHWKTSGAIGIKTVKSGFNAHFIWVQNNNRYLIQLAGPLGASAVQMQGAPGNIIVRDSKGIYRANSPEALLTRHFGWHLPISNLKYWIRGLPAPGTEANKQFDRYHRLQTLVQDSWYIQYQGYTNIRGMILPTRIMMYSYSVNVRIVIRNWILA